MEACATQQRRAGVMPIQKKSAFAPTCSFHRRGRRTVIIVTVISLIERIHRARALIGETMASGLLAALL